MSTRKMIEPREWPWYDHKRYSFCMAAQKGNYLFLSGNTASEFDPEKKKMVFKEGIVDQGIVNYDKIKIVVESAGGTMSDIIKMTDYVIPSEAANYSLLSQVRGRYFEDGDHPAGTAHVVNRLLRFPALLEVECVAVLGNAEKKIINPGWKGYGGVDYQPAVMKEDLLFISGQPGIDHKTGAIVGEDILAQTEQAYKNVQTLLEHAGASFNDVVKTIHYISPDGCAQYQGSEQVRAKYFKDSYSAHTAVVVNQNVPADALITVDCIAVVGKSNKELFDLGLKRYQGLSYGPAVKKGKLVCLSGITSVDLETDKFISGDVVEQQRHVLINAQKILGAVNLSWEDLMMAIDFIVPEAHQTYAGTAAVRHEFFQEALPPSTGVIQEQLIGDKGLLLNVDLIAATD